MCRQREVKCWKEQDIYHLGRNHQTRLRCVLMCPVTVPSMHRGRTNNLDSSDGVARHIVMVVSYTLHR
jgi:hypothetical protein